jgi:hypothetical protein
MERTIDELHKRLTGSYKGQRVRKERHIDQWNVVSVIEYYEIPTDAVGLVHNESSSSHQQRTCPLHDLADKLTFGVQQQLFTILSV